MKNIVITGANRGIGLGLVKELSRQGNNIYACVRNISSELSELLSESKEHGMWIRLIKYNGLDDEESIKTCAKEIFSGGGTVDVLINNAGISGNSTFLMASMKQMREIFEVNLFGTLLFTQYIARRMVAQKSGQIINIASVRGLEIEKGNILYGMSKSSLIYATKVMAKELIQHNISVNAVAPGYIPTDINANKSEKTVENILERTALKKHGDISDVVNAVSFLVEHPSINGQIIRADGGYTAEL